MRILHYFYHCKFKRILSQNIGDDRSTAIAIGSAVGIPPSNILANAKPDDKERFLLKLQQVFVHKYSYAKSSNQ